MRLFCMMVIDFSYFCASILLMAWRSVKLSGRRCGKTIAQALKKPPKYHNVKENGFDSKREENRYHQLLLLEKAGLISDLRRQVRFELTPRMAVDGRHELASHYVADFVYRDNETGKTVVEDAKGVRTREYVLKRKMMLHRYGIAIQEV